MVGKISKLMKLSFLETFFYGTKTVNVWISISRKVFFCRPLGPGRSASAILQNNDRYATLVFSGFCYVTQNKWLELKL